MNQSELYVSLDIGSSSVKVLIGEVDGGILHVIGVGNVQSAGIRKGQLLILMQPLNQLGKQLIKPNE